MQDPTWVPCPKFPWKSYMGFFNSDRLFLKWIKDFLILYDTTFIKVLLIFKTPEATFKGIRIKSGGKPCFGTLSVISLALKDMNINFLLQIRILCLKIKRFCTRSFLRSYLKSVVAKWDEAKLETVYHFTNLVHIFRVYSKYEGNE